METICNMQWNEEDKDFLGLEKRIVEEWGLDRGTLDGLHQRDKICRVLSLNSLSTPTHLVYKRNFDGAMKGNPGITGFEGLCRNSRGEILQFSMD